MLVLMLYKPPILLLIKWSLFGCLCLNQYHHLLLSIPSHNGVSLVYVNSTTFIFNCCRFKDSPHFCMSKVHLIIVTSSSSISTPLGPIFLNMVFPFRWSTMELIGMFHDLLTFLRECVPLSTISIATSNVPSVHMPLLVFRGIRFSCGDDLLFCW